MHLNTKIDQFMQNPGHNGRRGIPLTSSNWDLEREYMAGKVIEVLARMVEDSKLIQHGGTPDIDFNAVHIYGIMIDEFEISHRGRRMLSNYPGIITEIHLAYKINARYVFERTLRNKDQQQKQ